MKTISKPVIDILPVNQLDEFACRQLDRVHFFFVKTQNNILIFISGRSLENTPPQEDLRVMLTKLTSREVDEVESQTGHPDWVTKNHVQDPHFHETRALIDFKVSAYICLAGLYRSLIRSYLF